jgi:hypothetical protein
LRFRQRKKLQILFSVIPATLFKGTEQSQVGFHRGSVKTQPVNVVHQLATDAAVDLHVWWEC